MGDGVSKTVFGTELIDALPCFFGRFLGTHKHGDFVVTQGRFPVMFVHECASEIGGVLHGEIGAFTAER